MARRFGSTRSQEVARRHGDEALRQYERYGAEIDLVLLDLTMPGKPGDEVYRELLQRDPSVRVLIMSGYARGESLGDLPETGVRFLQKPFTVTVLLNAIAEVMDNVTGSPP